MPWQHRTDPPVTVEGYPGVPSRARADTDPVGGGAPRGGHLLDRPMILINPGEAHRRNPAVPALVPSMVSGALDPVWLYPRSTAPLCLCRESCGIRLPGTDRLLRVRPRVLGFLVVQVSVVLPVRCPCSWAPVESLGSSRGYPFVLPFLGPVCGWLRLPCLRSVSVPWFLPVFAWLLGFPVLPRLFPVPGHRCLPLRISSLFPAGTASDAVPAPDLRGERCC
jgi:hypothetical protein